jgi:hypothetical protein
VKFKPSILAFYSIAFLTWCIGYTIYNYEELSEGEGWGLVGMTALSGLGLFLLIGSVVLDNVVKNKLLSNFIGLLVAIATSLLVMYGGLFS